MKLPVGDSPAIGRKFLDLGEEITAAILKTVDAGWQVARMNKAVVASADEVIMTECLRDGMRSAMRDCKFAWNKTMIVAPGTESRSQPGMTKPDGRTDIPLYLTHVFAEHGEHDPHAIIECKRVAEGNAHLAREYVVEGIDRFKSGKYSDNHSVGFMVGYVVVGETEPTVDGINAYLARKSRSSEQLALSSLLCSPISWISEHVRGVNSVGLHHAMLPV